MNNKQVWVLFSFCLLFFISCVQSINRITWYLQEFLPGWILLILFLLILYVLVNGIFGIGWRSIQSKVTNGINYLYRKPVRTSFTAKNTAIHRLKIIDHNLHQLRDKQQAESLLQEKIRLEGELKRRDLVTVVFGTGSSGKTSLIRALTGRTIGTVNASMGSTNNCSQYRIYLTKSKRGLILIDTPGILESGHQGHAREVKARWEASR
ncbi:MAG TPA: 50S ribosome-binding GTPase, partial [Prochlorococcaceae cyanobacterium AMR_MDS_5431]|nr:50S ribosome-binding GTPase [Prochlorococcaceae cyanobacterium AMR_MDS_5431]